VRVQPSHSEGTPLHASEGTPPNILSREGTRSRQTFSSIGNQDDGRPELEDDNAYKEISDLFG
jgi:hypothetical protein